ncbi:oligosaccharide flippase family protein [Vibrio sp. IRLE0018]|uniref:lipopolysaccharide biosynthesis protein n=1 Tax=Vibrio floridensis TaxID=2908007 RepID=UPI001F02ECE2|nr:oligosaccharide flippase family protein [Vibrio floridensis]MCF8780319.1 oligosaccharide flippase family protein [Vibrio floridensis]
MKNNIIYVAGTFLNSAIPFLFLPILSRILEPAEYGQMNLLLTIYALLMPLTSISLSSYLYKRFFDKSGLGWNVFLHCFRTVSKWIVILLLLVSSLVVIYLAYNEVDDLAIFFAIPLLTLAGFCNSIYVTLLQIYTAQGKSVRFLVTQVSYTLAVFSATLLFLFVFELRDLSRIVGVILIDVLYFFVCYQTLKKELIKAESTPFPNETNRFITYGLGLMPHLVASVLLSTADKFIISAHLSMADLAIYAVAVQYSSILMIFTQGLSKDWGRQFFKLPSFRQQKKRLTMLVSFILLCAVCLYFMKGIFYTFFVGESLRKGFDVLLVLIFSQVFHSIYILVSIYIKHNGKTYYLSAFTMIALVTNILFSLSLVDSMGLIGVAIGTLIGMSTKCVLVIFYVFIEHRKARAV